MGLIDIPPLLEQKKYTGAVEVKYTSCINTKYVGEIQVKYIATYWNKRNIQAQEKSNTHHVLTQRNILTK